MLSRKKLCIHKVFFLDIRFLVFFCILKYFKYGKLSGEVAYGHVASICKTSIDVVQMTSHVQGSFR